MKKIYFIIYMFLASLAGGNAQVIPNGMNYQAVARNLKGDIIVNQKISLRISLFDQDNQKRNDRYSEIHHVTTNDQGLFSLIVGEGSVDQGEFGLIPWNTENIWMEVSIKDKNQSEFATVSSNRLQAVPYAIHAGAAGKLATSLQPSASSLLPPEPGVVSNFWSVFGNAKTDFAGNPFRVNSLGTTDRIDLIMITDNVERLRMLSTGDIVTKLNFDVGKNLKVDQNLYVVLSATIGDSLIAKHNVLLNTTGGNTIVYGPFTVANQSPTLLQDKLLVDRSTDLNSTLNVDGATDINARLFVNNMSPTHLTGTLQVDSVTNLNDAFNVNNMSPTILTGKLRVDSCATFNDKVKILSTFQTDTSGFTPSGSLQVGGGAYIKKNLYVGGIAKFGGPVAFGGQVAIQDATQSTDPMTGALRVFGGVGIGLNLNVGGAAMIGQMLTIKDLTESNDTVTGALKVFGGVGIKKRLNVGGATKLWNTLDVYGWTNLNNALNVTAATPFIANFVNTTDANGISIRINSAAPGWSNNFVEFRNSGSGVVGRIEGENATEYTTNPLYIIQNKKLESNIVYADINVAVATLSLAGAIAGVVAAATSFTGCAGLGFCVTVPIISFIVKAALDVAAKTVGLGLAVAQQIKAKDRKNEWVSYKASHIGVTYESGSGDYAEWLPKADSSESFLPGYIVGLKDGRITKNLEGVNKLLVISTKPIILGNAQSDEDSKSFEKVAFLGQVPVHVVGKVNKGDYIIPSGYNDGLGRAIDPNKIEVEDYSKIVGKAWSASTNEGYNMIRVAIGLHDGDINKVLVDHQYKIKDLQSKFNQSNAILSKLLPGYNVKSSMKEILENDPGSLDASNVASGGHSIESLMDHPEYLQISDAQIDDLLTRAEKAIQENGGSTENNVYLNMLKSDPSFKNQFIQNVQAAYKKEIQKNIGIYKPFN